jgi:chorismate mutase/prephenate dehydratase
LENSFEGGVTQTMEGFLRSELMIRQEVFTPIHHSLLSQESELAEIKKVYSHPQGLAQCRKWLTENLPRAELINMPSTTAASKLVATERGSAAIASALAAEVFGLRILREGILSQSQNTTRFAVLSKDDAAPTGKDRTSLVLTMDKGKPLSEVLEIFRKVRLPVLRIESKPSSQARWSYLYFMDVQGHREERAVERALKAARAKAGVFKILGSYPDEGAR